MQPQNRVFLALTIGLVALLAIGLIAVGAWVILRPKETISQAPAVTAAEEVTSTPIPSATPTAVPPTSTPLPTARPTNTPVIAPLTPVATQVSAAATASSETGTQAGLTPIPTATPFPLPEETPRTGFGLVTAGLVGLGLGGVAFFARKLRSSS